MPTLPPVAATLRTVIKGVYGDGKWANVLHWRWSGDPPDNAKCATIASDLLHQWGINLAPLFPNGVTVHECEATDLTSSSAGQGTAFATHTGLGSGFTLPNNCAILLNHRISRRYKGGHPRTYLPPPAGSFMAGSDVFSSPAQSSIEASWEAFRAGFIAEVTGPTSIVGLVNVSYYSGTSGIPPRPVLRTTPEVDDIIGTTCNIHLATQRRRIPR